MVFPKSKLRANIFLRTDNDIMLFTLISNLYFFLNHLFPYVLKKNISGKLVKAISRSRKPVNY